MKRKAITNETFAIGNKIIVIDDNHLYASREGVIERLGSAGDDVIYIHARLQGINTIIAFRTFQVQKGS